MGFVSSCVAAPAAAAAATAAGAAAAESGAQCSDVGGAYALPAFVRYLVFRGLLTIAAGLAATVVAGLTVTAAPCSGRPRPSHTSVAPGGHASVAAGGRASSAGDQRDPGGAGGGTAAPLAGKALQAAVASAAVAGGYSGLLGRLSARSSAGSTDRPSGGSAAAAWGHGGQRAQRSHLAEVAYSEGQGQGLGHSQGQGLGHSQGQGLGQSQGQWCAGEGAAATVVTPLPMSSLGVPLPGVLARLLRRYEGALSCLAASVDHDVLLRCACLPLCVYAAVRVTLSRWGLKVGVLRGGWRKGAPWLGLGRGCTVCCGARHALLHWGCARWEFVWG